MLSATFTFTHTHNWKLKSFGDYFVFPLTLMFTIIHYFDLEMNSTCYIFENWLIDM